MATLASASGSADESSSDGAAEVVLRQLGGDRAVLRELIGIFLDETPRSLDILREALRQNDPGAVQRAAHRFKGALGVFAAAPARDKAQQLELLGKRGDLSDAAELFATLEREVAGLMMELARFARQSESPG